MLVSATMSPIAGCGARGGVRVGFELGSELAIMVVRYIVNGCRVHGPPYTDEEVRDMFRRMQNGPRMMTSAVRNHLQLLRAVPQPLAPGSPARQPLNRPCRRDTGQPRFGLLPTGGAIAPPPNRRSS